MMKLLISFGGNPNAMDTEKWTPLVRVAAFNLILDASFELPCDLIACCCNMWSSSSCQILD